MYHWRYRSSDVNLLNYYPSYIISEDTNNIFDNVEEIATSKGSSIISSPRSHKDMVPKGY